jgi:hypothetical protein
MARRLMIILLALSGCGEAAPTICARPGTETPKPFTEGFIEDGKYYTSRWDGPLLPFPGGTWYKIKHGLGKTPSDWRCFLSFDPNGVRDGSSVSQAAGNQAVLKAIDEQTMTILNETCVDHFLLCTASP